MAFEESLGHLDVLPACKDVLRSVLYEQTIHYPSRMNHAGDLDPLHQTTGQLMGSTLSFPILCAVNLVAYWAAVEEYLGRPVDPQELPVLVNGDDILFRSDPRLYAMWLTNIRDVGFSLSLGKNYVHPHILTVNSQVFQFTAPDTFRYVGYYNTGLLTGQSKVTGRANARLAPVWALYNEVVRGAVNPARAHRRFLHYHKTDIAAVSRMNESTTFNLGLPFQRGGLGFEIPDSITTHITAFQRRFASYLEGHTREMVLIGSEPRLLLGLVTERKTTREIPIKHVPILELIPSVGPMNKYYSEYTPMVYTLPPLSQDIDPDRPELIVKFPRKHDMRAFRSGTYRRMSSQDIHHWPYRLAEVVHHPMDEATEGLVC